MGVNKRIEEINRSIWGLEKERECLDDWRKPWTMGRKEAQAIAYKLHCQDLEDFEVRESPRRLGLLEPGSHFLRNTFGWLDADDLRALLRVADDYDLEVRMGCTEAGDIEITLAPPLA